LFFLHITSNLYKSKLITLYICKDIKLRNYQLKISFTFIFLFFYSIPYAIATSPNEVFQEAENLTLNIQEIRRQQKITTEARKPGVQIAKTPIHAYTKALEVFEKVSRFNALKGWPVSKTPGLPNTKVLPSDVLQLITEIAGELQAINQKMGITFTKTAKLPIGKTPSDVYEILWFCSYLLDDLAGGISPTYVYRNTVRIEKSLLVIANKLNKSTDITEPLLEKGLKPIDANIEGFKVLYQLVDFEKKNKMPPVRVSGFPAGKITPADVYDTTNNIIAELTRINIKMSLPAVPNVDLSREKITPNEVVFQLKKVQLLLNNISL